MKDKQHIHYCLLFRFHKKSSAHRIICETYDENVIERVRIDLNNVKMIFILVTKNAVVKGEDPHVSIGHEPLTMAGA